MAKHIAVRSVFSNNLLITTHARLFALAVIVSATLTAGPSARADSVNSPNINLNVDTNRATGNGAGNVAVTINTITIAETMLPEYASGAGQTITINARPGFQFDSTSNVTCQSATIGFNSQAINTAATLTATGAANEVLTFEFTSGTDVNVQDILRINGIKIRILDDAGAAGPAQQTMSVTTTGAGGSFTDQGIVAANIVKGVPDHLEFSIQPGTTQTGEDILPAVVLVDFGGNIITNDPREITLSIQDNPGAATLNGITARTTVNGVATWVDDDNMNIVPSANDYTLSATHDGANLQTSDTIESGAFDILAGAPNHMSISLQPMTTDAGSPILIDVSILDSVNNVVTNAPVDITLTSAINPGGWPLLVDTSLTKTTVNGVASWSAADNLRINAAITAYKLAASGLGGPLETDPFDVTPGDADHLLMTQQPATSPVGANLLVTVEVVDAFNNLITDDPTDVRLDLTTNPGAATLEVASSLTKTTTDGVAMWDETDMLRINVAADGYRLLASGVGPATESDPFNITDENGGGNGGGDGMNGGDMNACGADCGAGAMMTPLMMLALGRRQQRRNR